MTPTITTAPRLRRGHIFLAALTLGLVTAFWSPLVHLVSLSLDDPRYSHLVLIPLISAFFFYRERRRIFSTLAPPPGVAFLFVGAALLVYALSALKLLPASADYTLSLQCLALVGAWVAGFALCYGPQAFRSATFPLFLLLLFVPVPFNLMDLIIAGLQRGSSELTWLVFNAAGVPMYRHGVSFELPGIGIEIAKECSSIHSGWALFITGLLVGHMFLKSVWKKLALSVLTIPIAMFTNAVRITTLWFLATKVDMSFLTGDLHHRGGILFSLVSLSVLMSVLFLFRRLEAR